MKKKLTNTIFIFAFLACMVVPALFMNTKEMQISSIDNKLLTEWPGFDPTLSNNTEVESYLNDRIGFREQAIEAYTVLNDKLFHVMVHPLFMYGKEGHIFYKDPTYIKGYQHMNTDEEYLDTFVDFLSATEAYLKDKDIEFLYFLCPDKKTIYPEYFPGSVHVNESNPGITDYMKEQLDKTDVDYIIPVEELKAAKSEKVVYNKLYDATHWNEDGAFIGHKLIDERIQKFYDDVRPLTEDDYTKTTVHEDTLDVARFSIDEDVPHYVLKEDRSNDMTTYLYDTMEYEDNTFYSHFTCPDSGNDRILLVFCDSYFGNYHKYYQDRFKEVYFVHWHNYKYLEYYVNLFFPDMVIYETAERSISGEMIGERDEDGKRISTIEYTDVYYEAPYYMTADVDREAAKTYGSEEGIERDAASHVGYVITETKGVERDGTNLLLNVNEGASVISINGYLESLDGGKYDVYANLGGERWVECNFWKLKELSEEAGYDQFSVNLQRRYAYEETITLVAVSRETGKVYLLDDLNIVYNN